MRRIVSKIWSWLVEWELFTIPLGVVIVFLAYAIISRLPWLPWEAKLMPSLDAFIYWAQSALLFFATMSVIWLWVKLNIPEILQAMESESLNNAIKAGMANRPLLTAFGVIAVFISLVIVFCLIMMAVFA